MAVVCCQVSCSAFFAKNRQHFDFITHHADYLNPLTNDTSKTPNLVDKSLQTTRRFDALKLWMTLRTMGVDGLGKVTEHVMDLAQQTYNLMSRDAEFEMIHQPEISTLVFRFI
ncbi:MAG: decarboxylase, partial [Alteromonadaceae bacterium]|nr:decarboxylase [Alteromonadaceae bacterium]